ncbi:uncharacterized protein [Oryza sativa Japonica Group]|uniref:uncharacterized protein isoform X2 n=1 Tax=Oryza sativa subsp. japonica TaxID=39947 RepID=UPI000E1BE873|nr:uncharacterized protein LOC4352055 isoform X2 [Oryza sativa Japonica Group]
MSRFLPYMHFGPSNQLQAASHVMQPREIARLLLGFWSEWATQILVVLSLIQQFFPLFFSGIRRRQGRNKRRAVLWLAYKFANITATYALGRLSLSAAQRSHRLVPFWAPFLLLHLAGPDNITAYSLEDSKIAGRHALTLFVQGLGAVFVLVKHVGSSRTLLLPGAIMVTTVAVFKMFEKTWALWIANFKVILSSVEREDGEEEPRQLYRVYLEEDELPRGGFKGKEVDEEEFLMRRAHAVFLVCKSAMVDSSMYDPDRYFLRILAYLRENRVDLWTLMEMELSLMYDILYTKAAVIHTWTGYCIRIVSSLTVAASFLLFQLYGKEGQSSRADITITYVLLSSSLLMEMASLLSALWSTWTFSFLCATRWTSLRHAALCSKKWHCLRNMVLSFRRLACSTGIWSYLSLSRRWSGTLGQYNMLDACTARPPLLGKLVVRLVFSRLSKKLGFSRLAEMLGFGRLAEELSYNVVTADIPKGLKDMVIEYIKFMIKDRTVNTLGIFREQWGKVAIKRWLEDKQVDDEYKEYLEKRLGAELHEGIIVWHIATDIFIAQRKADDQDAVKEAVKALSNYMMFLLVKQPDMLPGLAQNKMYQWTKESLAKEWEEAGVPAYVSGLHPSQKLANMLHDKEVTQDLISNRLFFATQLAKRLLERDDTMKLVYGIWVDFLIYASNRCSRESHAKRLNNDGQVCR